MSKRRSGLFNDRRVNGCCNIVTRACVTTSIQGLRWDYFVPTGEYSQYSAGWALFWNPIPNGTVYLITQPGTLEQTFELLTPTSGNLYTNNTSNNDFVVYAHVRGCPDISGNIAPCFFLGAIVSMADGSTKVIEDVRVGDMVIGAFGEHNKVLALHRPLLGKNTMTNINNEHHTSSHHPHISFDKKFYAVKPAVVMSDTYGQSHEVLDENMVPYQRFLAGLKPGRVEVMEVGVILKTVEGSRAVTFLDTYEMAPETQLYHLAVSGSHTYYVNGYAVTGWPNEEDFDYDLWEARNE
jgi:hypothetical protein